MSEWKEYKLGDLASIKGGKRLPKGTLLVDYETPHPYIRIVDLGKKWIMKKGLQFVEPSVQKSISKYTVKANDVILSIVGSIGLVSRITNELDGANLTENCVKIIPLKNLDKDFLYYYLISPTGQDEIFIRNVGAVQPKLPLYNIKDIPILLPSLSEQIAIASVLSNLDDKIDLLHRQNATLEKIAETIFRQWFVEPFNRYVNEGIGDNDFSNAKFEKWVEGTVGGEWGKTNSEGDFNKIVYCLRGTDIADLNEGLPEKTPIRFVKEVKFKNIEPREGDLIIEISGGTESQSTGRVCYVNQDIKNLFMHPLIFSNFCRMIRVKKPEYSFFLYCYMKYLYNQDEFFNLENGSSGIKNLDYKALLFELEYPMPTEKPVLEFHNQVEHLFKKVNHNKIQITTLAALRDTLLLKLISGEIRVDIH